MVNQLIGAIEAKLINLICVRPGIGVSAASCSTMEKCYRRLWEIGNKRGSTDSKQYAFPLDCLRRYNVVLNNRVRRVNSGKKAQCGFIVEVRSTSSEPIRYWYGDEFLKLNPDEIFVGYFRQIVTTNDRGTQFQKAYVIKTDLVDPSDKIFVYGEEAIFDYGDIEITIKALRGPFSNNRHLDDKFHSLETWNVASN